MAIQFYLDIEGKRHVLPVNPGEISVSTSSNSSTQEVVKLGDVNILGGRVLADTSFSSIFPKDYSQSYVNQHTQKHPPNKWVQILESARNSNHRVRLIVTDTKINMLMTIEKFEWGYVDATGDVEYSIDLKEYRDHSAKYLKTVKKKVSPAPRPKPPANKPITPGCAVIVNGRLHRDSYGTGPGKTEKNARRKVNFIKKGRSHPYHVTLEDGGWRGWVTAGSVRRV